MPTPPAPPSPPKPQPPPSPPLAPQAKVVAARQELTANSLGLGFVTQAHTWAAANPSSNLYSILNWDDASAAQAYREYQIIQLITGGVV